MVKKSLIGICVYIIWLFVFSSLSNVASSQAIQSPNTFDDVVIDIRAGVHDNTNGDYGLGFLICITNDMDENITGTITLYWNFTSITIGSAKNGTFALSAHHPEIKIAEIDWLHFPFPILKLQIIVTVNEILKSVSRSGIEIGPFVFFSHQISSK